MLIILPTATDAPINHWPFATAGLVATNVACFMMQLSMPQAIL